jgi:hypothetical protein
MRVRLTYRENLREVKATPDLARATGLALTHGRHNSLTMLGETSPNFFRQGISAPGNPRQEIIVREGAAMTAIFRRLAPLARPVPGPRPAGRPR